ncbi:MAG: alpha/beta hydrolase [Planctomycetes bacterium]|nr:alpha/beta hydrolase [Planctomycetota bacterium]
MSAGVEEPRIVVSDGHRLDGVIARPRGTAVGTAAVAHPHPAHGGNMDHSVVRTAAARAVAAGLVALRFDVRGVRHSDGDVDDPAGHLEDLYAAGDAVADEGGRDLPRYGVGFSYGARLWLEAMRTPTPPPVRGLVLLAPATRVPRTARDFGDLLLGRPIRDAALDLRVLERLERVPVPTVILVGENDVVAPPHEVARHAGPLARVDVLPGLNHFFAPGAGAGATDVAALSASLDRAFATLLARR